MYKPTGDVPDVEHPFEFSLDQFQKYAMYAISKDENVLVTAKTGSGKTLVGEYQIYHSLKKNKRVFYTTPIKSLSNQKFHDLKKLYPSVGIMTGDIKFAPQSDIVIMTTEILRNLLFKKGTQTENIGITAELSIDNVDSVIFDEVHYLNDPDRGKIWEECFMLMPNNINLVLLSATIHQPEPFAEWLGNLKSRTVHLISTNHRVVPLIHMLPNDKVLMDAKEEFYPQVYNEWIKEFENQEKAIQKHKDKVKESDKVVHRDVREYSFIHRMNEFIGKGKLPALFFVLSRKLCAEYAKKVTHTLITTSDAAAIRHIVSFHLHKYPEVMISDQYFELLPLLEKGIAFHHSGVLPLLKEIIEILFGRGLIKVLFATETFAVGLNMPTKTVVFTSFRKQGDSGMRMLRPDEYTQMAGRAGRRGKDTEGYVYYMPQKYPEPMLEMKMMMSGLKPTIHTRMKLDYQHILQTINNPNFLDNSYWKKERHESIMQVESDILNYKSKLVPVDNDCKERYEIDMMPNSKDKQKLLNKWMNSHMGPKWISALESFKNNIKTEEKIKSLESTLDCLRNPIELVERRRFLDELGYIGTKLGLLASEVYEGHALLMSYAFYSKIFHNLTANQTVCILSIFIEAKGDDVSYFIPEASIIKLLDEYADNCSRLERLKSDDLYWKLSLHWYPVVEDWMNEDTSKNICRNYEIEEGTFVRNILKLSNLLDEWRNLAKIMEDVEMIDKLKDIKIIREVVVPESLYLRI